MFTKDRIFELALEDYSCPRHQPFPKYYYGSMEAMIKLMLRMEDDGCVQLRYKETLDAAEYYDLDNEITHTVAGITVPIFTPVQEVFCLETSLYNKEWAYKAYNETLYPCKASEIELRQSLVQTDDGYELCVQANIIGLTICYPGIGWVCPNGLIKGFPHMVTFDGTVHRMALATSQAHYMPDELERAMTDALNPNSANLALLVADILGER